MDKNALQEAKRTANDQGDDHPSRTTSTERRVVIPSEEDEERMTTPSRGTNPNENARSAQTGRQVGMCDKEEHPEVQDETTQDPKGEESPMAAKDLTSEAKLHKDEQHAANQPKGEVHTMSTLGKMEAPITHPHTPIGQLKAAKAAKAKAQRAQQTQQLSPLQVEPLMLNMRAQRNNMTEAERE